MADNNSDSEPIMPVSNFPTYRGSLFRYWHAAGQKSSKYQLFSFSELTDPNLYRCVLAEFVGTFLFQILHIGLEIESQGLSYGIGTALVYWFLLLAFGPTSGGHLNPLISISTMATGYTSPFRGILYVLFQLFGGFLAIKALDGVYEGTALATSSGKCGYWMTDSSSGGAAVMFDGFFDLIYLFFVYALAIDARASSVFGPGFGSFLLAFSYGTLTYVAKGFNALQNSNASANPSQVYTGYTWGENYVFCVMSDALYTSNDVVPDEWAQGGGVAFGGILVSVFIHTLLYYALLPLTNFREHQDEEIARNKMLLKIV